jgi:pseudo-response regulator 7
VFDPPVECNAANYSVNGAISGSNNGSNGQNGCSAAPSMTRPTIENVPNGIMAKNGAGGGSGSGSGSGTGMYHNRYPQREAALNKFRLKRKDRNFSKQVTYFRSYAFVVVKLLPCEHEVMGSSLGNNLLQKCRKMFRT